MAVSRPARTADDVAGKQIKRTIWSGVLAGVGLVAFADETVFHQLLHWHHLHQIRYHVNLWPYDLTWNLIATVMIAAGAALMTGLAGVAGSAMFRSDAATAA